MEICWYCTNPQKRLQRISLLSITSKVLERCVFTRLYDHLKCSITELQHRFLKNRSCATQLLLTLHSIGLNLDKNIQTDVVYLDFAKAFDSVDHKILLAKLRTHGVAGRLLSWFDVYLTGRTQRVVLEGASSQWTPVTSGVPPREPAWSATLRSVYKWSTRCGETRRKSCTLCWWHKDILCCSACTWLRGRAGKLIKYGCLDVTTINLTPQSARSLQSHAKSSLWIMIILSIMLSSSAWPKKRIWVLFSITHSHGKRMSILLPRKLTNCSDFWSVLARWWQMCQLDELYTSPSLSRSSALEPKSGLQANIIWKPRLSEYKGEQRDGY